MKGIIQPDGSIIISHNNEFYARIIEDTYTVFTAKMDKTTEKQKVCVNDTPGLKVHCNDKMTLLNVIPPSKEMISIHDGDCLERISLMHLGVGITKHSTGAYVNVVYRLYNKGALHIYKGVRVSLKDMKSKTSFTCDSHVEITPTGFRYLEPVFKNIYALSTLLPKESNSSGN